MKFFKKYITIFSIIIITFVFFYPFFIQGKLPIPSDTIVGLYHPFRDLYSDKYPNGVPFKNFLITDPVRQQYPWKKFTVDALKNGNLPVWNPYEMSGKPQISNFQTGVFYPLNLILFISPFYISWSIFIFLQPLLGAVFMYLFLRNLKINDYASFLGAFCFAFSGFMISWLEWGVVGHTYLWLPFILLSIDKGFLKKNIFWKNLYAISLTISFFAGHLQVFLYIFIVSIIYFTLRLIQLKKEQVKILFSFIFVTGLVVGVTAVQWIPTYFFLNLSNRAYDQIFQNVGWFIPWENLVMFIAPDYFGNPSTLNYYGVWNYGEFIGYIGIVGIIFVLYAIFFRRDKKTLFFFLLFLGTLLFATPNIISRVPFQLNIPFLANAQPTRLIGVASFALAALAALGLDLFMRKRNKIWLPGLVVGVTFAAIFLTTLMPNFFPDINDVLVAKNNLKLPLIIFGASITILIVISSFLKKRKTFNLFVLLLIAISIFDLFRFGWKFTPFTQRDYLFPKTKSLKFLTENLNNNRIAVLDDRILPPNFQTIYKIKSISGYDPLYLKNYAQLIASNERNDHSITQPFGFNRIITPKNYNTQIFDLLCVKYLISLNYLNNQKLQLVFEEGQTKIYENKNVFPCTFFIKELIYEKNKDVIAKRIYESDLLETAFLNIHSDRISKKYKIGEAKVIKVSDNYLSIKTNNTHEGFLVISEVYYPLTSVKIDGKETDFNEVNLALIGIEVPKGEHIIEIKRKLL